jgi:hypothetical protein
VSTVTNRTFGCAGRRAVRRPQKPTAPAIATEAASAAARAAVGPERLIAGEPRTRTF